MGLGKKIKKAAKKVSKAVSSVAHSVEKGISTGYDSVEDKVSSEAQKVFGNAGYKIVKQAIPAIMNEIIPGSGTMFTASSAASGDGGIQPTTHMFAGGNGGELLNAQVTGSAVRALSQGVHEGSTTAVLHSAEGSAIHQGYESDSSSGFKQYYQDAMKRLTQDQMAYASAYAQELQNKADSEAIAKKNAMLGEMESDTAGGRPLNKTYLGSSTTGGYVDDEQIKKKKRLGGDKTQSTGGSGGTLS